MNYLGHLLLAGNHPDDLVGNLMGDFVKGPVDERVPARYRPGVKLHRRVDAFTDGHQVVTRARGRIGADYRRFAGIILDLWFDHLLALKWNTVHPVQLEPFAGQVYSLLRERWHELPHGMQHRMRYTISKDLLVGYRDEALVGRAIYGVGQRFRRPVDLSGVVASLDTVKASLAADFETFLPILQRYAKEEQQRLARTDGGNGIT